MASATDGLDRNSNKGQEPRRPMAIKDQNKRQNKTNKPKLSAKEKKEKKAKKRAAKKER